MSADALRLVTLNGLWLAAGLGITSAAGWWRGRGALGALGVSYLVGVAAYGVIAQLLFVLGFAMSIGEIVAVCLVLSVGILVRRAAPVRRLPSLRWAGAVVVVVFAVLAVDLWYQPLWAYDAWTFWTPKAHALSALGGLDASWFTQPVLANRDYPILLPAIEAAGFRFTGYETGLLDLQSFAFAAAALLAFAEIVVPRAPRWAPVLPVLVVASPSLADQLASAEADIPLAAFFACAAGAAYLWWREQDRSALVVFGVLCAGVAATKAEGLLFVVALTLPFVVVLLRVRAGAAVAFAGVAAAALAAAVLPWRIWSSRHGIPQQSSLGRLTDSSLVGARAHRLPTAVEYLVERLVDPRAWLLLVPLLATLTVLGWLRGRRTAAVVTAAVFLLSFSTLVLAYWTSQFEIHYHLSTSARRVVTGPILAWTFLLPLAWGHNGAFTAPRYPHDT
jgi:hypothetical protein